MVKVSMEVRKGAARISVAVCAESIRQAMDIIEGRFPESECRVKFPINPEEFFVGDAATKHPDMIAA